MDASTETNEALYPDVLRIRFEDGNMIWDFADGRSSLVPLAWYPTLMLATSAERANYHICHYSAHWPQLDCDLGANAIILGHKEAEFFASRAREKYAARTSTMALRRARAYTALRWVPEHHISQVLLGEAS